MKKLTMTICLLAGMLVQGCAVGSYSPAEELKNPLHWDYDAYELDSDE